MKECLFHCRNDRECVKHSSLVTRGRLLGRGIATEGVSAFVLLQQTRPLYAGVANDNVGSIRVLQKCGFKIQSVEEAANDADASRLPFTATA